MKRDDPAPMSISKILIANRGETRAAALARLDHALGALEVGGIPTTLPLHVALVRDADVAAARFHTRWLETWLAANQLASSP
jgi:acetyl-CoA carboxylase biotin carboxylase subunit